ncbi:immunoglobulin variable region used by the itc63b heavy chain [Fusarium acutatum]|uniref:Immunoglobulin variable region used by the itc63b heavy chain n=1 Tax=Fusarium acutatum TaxID=78861 RepID=A0A8H4JBV3_9HYPO|nr:immunoglobulin variable region used by the itc63b heavy chain [Fusarium acutatum]
MDIVDPRGTNISVLATQRQPGLRKPPLSTGNYSTEVDIVEVEENAAQWLEWQAPVFSVFHTTSTERLFTIVEKITTRSRGAVRTPTSPAAAGGYLSDYCSLHAIEDQKLVALMAALRISVAKYDGSIAFLNQLNDGNALLRTLIRRDPDIGALWVGAFMTGAHHKCLQRAQAA